MPVIDVNGTSMYYEDTGTEDKPAIVFAHGLLFSCRMFDAQVAAFKDRYRCVAFDHRGHGNSAVADDGYDLDTLAEDACQLIEKLAVAPCHFVGLSMGGMMGMRIGFRRPELLKSLILLETSADPEPRENLSKYNLLNFMARWFGLRVVTGQVMPILFGRKFMKDPAREADRKKWRDRIAKQHRIGITRSVKGVITRKGVHEDIARITAPTLIIVGDQDVATVPAKSERMHAQIPNSRLVIIPGAGHSSAIEEPEAVNAAISDFLESL